MCLTGPTAAARFTHSLFRGSAASRLASAVVISLAVFSLIPDAETQLFRSVLGQITPLLPAACLVFVLGLLDDLYDLRPWQKLSGQLAAATWIYVYGFRIESIAGVPFGDAYWITYPFTVAWLLACTNAFNLIDGIDGLASGVGFFATATMMISALLPRQHGTVDSDGASCRGLARVPAVQLQSGFDLSR